MKKYQNPVFIFSSSGKCFVFIGEFVDASAETWRAAADSRANFPWSRLASVVGVTFFGHRTPPVNEPVSNRCCPAELNHVVGVFTGTCSYNSWLFFTSGWGRFLSFAMSPSRWPMNFSPRFEILIKHSSIQRSIKLTIHVMHSDLFFHRTDVRNRHYTFLTTLFWPAVKCCFMLWLVFLINVSR